MKLLRNREAARTILVLTVISLAATAIAYIWHEEFGHFTLTVCLALLTVHIVGTYRRYSRICQLAADVDKVLHGGGQVSFDQYSEGELGILQSELYKMTARLRENEQRLLEDKRYLADSLADISHQLRTPLTSINLLVSLLSEPDISADRRQGVTRELYGLLERIDWLITTLLKISKLDAGTVQLKKETVSLRDLIQKSCEPLLIPIELRGQELEIQGEGMFHGDVAWTAEALGNIVKNCMEHTPDGGKIGIYAAENALYSDIRIHDNGTGIAQEDLPHIFERFYKGKNSDGKSFGVGLALARMIIISQNGTVKAENTDPGAQFTIRFYKGII